MKHISEEQWSVYTALVAYVHEHGFPPSVRTLCDLTGRTTATIHAHLMGLHRKGMLVRRDRGGVWWPAQTETRGDA